MTNNAFGNHLSKQNRTHILWLNIIILRHLHLTSGVTKRQGMNDYNSIVSPITLHLEHPFVMNIFVYTSWIIQISVFAEPCCWASAPNKELWWTYHYRKFICSDVRLRFVVTYPNSVRDFLLKYLIIIIIREGE